MKYGNPLLLALLVSLSLIVQAQNEDHRIAKNDEFIQKKSLFTSSQGDVFLYLKPKESAKTTVNQNHEVLSYDHEKGYLTRLPAEVDFDQLSKSYDLRYIGPEEKLSRLLRHEEEDASYNIWFHSTVDLQKELDEIEKFISLEILDVNNEQKKVEVKFDSQSMKSIQNFGSVRYISPAFKSPRLLMDNSINMVRANTVQSSVGIGSDLSGKDIHVGVWDGGLVGRHIDLDFNVINEEKDFFSSSFSQHSTHVSGIVGGKSLRSTNVFGIAPNSEIHTYNFFGDVVAEIKGAVNEKNVSITNSSFALPAYQLDCFNSGTYLPEASELDKFTNEKENVHHVVAVGNAGFGLCDDAYSTVEIGFQGAKNNITVGWTDINENIWVGSSRGPTVDGRLKPELVAEGAQVVSTALANGYQNRWGSSQSSPTVAGIVALLSEQYKKDHGSLPRADLIKAILCTGARDKGPEGADFTWGYGIANAYLSNEILKNGDYVLSSLTDGDSMSFDINVPAGTEYLRATLVWTDKEAVLPASKILVNDLDFNIKGPSLTLLPWVNDPQNPSAPPVRGVDDLNNIEGISLINPDPGTYKLKIKGSDIPMGSQKFAVAYQFGGPSDMQVTHPIGGEKWLPGVPQFIRWDDFGLDENFEIEYSIDNGMNWISIVSDIASTQRFYLWTVPNLKSHEVKIRVKTATHQSESEVFTIMSPVPTFTGTVCENHITLNWPKVDVATAYDILQLDEQGEYVVIGSTTDTNFVVSRIFGGKEYWIALVAKDTNGSSRRSWGLPFVGNFAPCDFNQPDIGISKLIAPLGGHKFTSSELTNSETIEVRIKNYSNMTISGFDLCYKLNNGATNCESFSDDLLPNEIKSYSFSITGDFSVAGAYELMAWTTLPGDVNRDNDTLTDNIIVDANLPLTLPYVEDFESIDQSTFVCEKIALSNLPRFDFIPTTNEGRLQAQGPEQFAEEGAGCLTLDNYAGSLENINEAVLNLNLSNHVDSNLYLDFSYLDHSQETHPNNAVYFRGTDADPWIEIYKLDDNSNGPGSYTKVSAISLADEINVAGQTFSSSSQLKFSQAGMLDANYLNAADGYSFDNIVVFNAGVDLSLDGLFSPDVRCDQDSFQLQIQVTNLNLNTAATNVELAYQIDGGDFVVENHGSLGPEETKIYTFNRHINLPKGNHEFNVEVRYGPDKFIDNNKIEEFALIITETKTFDAEDLVTFEDTNEWIASGQNSSWEWGTPNNIIISQSGEGVKSYVTELSSGYNPNENSYLTTQCYDFTTISENIQLSFLGILDVETSFDGAFLEYSEDGLNWSILGTNGSGFNWYNNAMGGDFWDVDITTWQTFSNTLDLDALSDKSKVLFRMRLISDEFIHEEGVGIDNFYLTTTNFDILDSVNMVTTTNLTTTLGEWTQALTGNELLAEVITRESISAEIGTANSQNCFNSFHLANRSYFIKSDKTEAIDEVRLGLSNKEYMNLVARAGDNNAVQGRLGVIAYEGLNVDTKIDNNLGNFLFISPEDVVVVPYKNGYLIEFIPLDTDAEYYIYYDLADPALSFASYFDAELDANDSIEISFGVNQINGIDKFEIQVSTDGLSFNFLDTIAPTAATSYSTIDGSSEQIGILYYRLLVTLDDGSTKFGGMDTLSFNEVICESDSFTFSYSSTAENCNQSDGSVAIEVINGTRPYTYEWPSMISMSNDSVLTNLNEGMFILSVRDANNCAFSDTIAIDNRNPIIELEAISFVSCFGAADGFINIAVTDGLIDGNLLWSTGDSGTNIDSLSQGNYSVMYTDSDGCTAEGTYGIQENDSLHIVIDSIVDASDGLSNGAIYISVVGGSGFNTYSWNNGSSTEDLLNISQGDYSLIAMDDNGCVDSIEARVDDAVFVSNGFIDQLLVYPNPANGELNISFESDQTLKGLKIASVDGRVLKDSRILNQSVNLVTVNVENLDEGVYLLTLDFGGNQYSHIFMKTRD